MKSRRPVARYYACVSAAVACTAAVALCSPREGAWDFGVVHHQSAHLDCANARLKVLEPDLVTPCPVLAQAQVQVQVDAVAPG
jgi:hypothetical protein